MTNAPKSSRRPRGPLAALLLAALLPACTATRPSPAPPPPPPRVEVLSSRIEANDAFVEVRFRLAKGGKEDPDTESVYLLDVASGERFYTMRLQRVGRLAENGSEEAVHTVLFKNRDGILRPGARVVLVMGASRRELLLKE